MHGKFHLAKTKCWEGSNRRGGWQGCPHLGLSDVHPLCFLILSKNISLCLSLIEHVLKLLSLKYIMSVAVKGFVTMIICQNRLVCVLFVLSSLVRSTGFPVRAYSQDFTVLIHCNLIFMWHWFCCCHQEIPLTLKCSCFCPINDWLYDKLMPTGGKKNKRENLIWQTRPCLPG